MFRGTNGNYNLDVILDRVYNGLLFDTIRRKRLRRDLFEIGLENRMSSRFKDAGALEAYTFTYHDVMTSDERIAILEKINDIRAEEIKDHEERAKWHTDK